MSTNTPRTAEERLAGHFADNPASGRVLVKAGFVHTGDVVPRFSLAQGEAPARRMMGGWREAARRRIDAGRAEGADNARADRYRSLDIVRWRWMAFTSGGPKGPPLFLCPIRRRDLEAFRPCAARPPKTADCSTCSTPWPGRRATRSCACA